MVGALSLSSRACAATTARAIEDGERGPAFDVHAWGVAEGLPGTHVNGVVQDDDGFLWIATLTGLVRFDGSSFRVFDESSGDLPSNRITVVHRGPTGRLWVGTQQGHVLEIRGNGFHLVGEPPYPGSIISTLAEDADGNLWASRAESPFRPLRALVWQLVDGALVPREDLDALWVARDGTGAPRALATDGSLQQPPSGVVVALSRDATGDVWGHLPTGRQVRLRDGAASPLGEPSLTTIEATSQSLFTRTGDLIEVFTMPELPAVGAVAPRPWQVLWLVDRRGLIWETSADVVGQDVLRAYRGDATEPAVEIPLGTTVRDAMEDREGNLWLSTMTRGLLRISEAPAQSLGPEDGVPLPVAVGLLPDGEVFLEEAPLGPCRPLHRVTSRGAVPLKNACGWVLEDRGGTVWTFDQDGLFGRSPGLPERRLAVAGSWIVEDPVEDGVLWVVEQRALRRIDTGAEGGPQLTGEWPLSAQRALVGDSQGGLWIGTDHGLYRLQGDELQRFGREDGLPAETVRALLLDSRGGLWLGTYGGGLVHWDGSTFTTFGRERGLPEAIVSSLVEDGRGGVWMSGNRGVHRVKHEELDRALSDPNHVLRITSFGEDLPNPETTGRPGVRSPDGRLWFPTFGGVLVVDPAVIERREAHLPLVTVVAVESSAGLRRPGLPLVIEHGSVRDVTFDFTATYLSQPESLRFRTRLEPLDADWVDQGSERRTRYRDLRPGEYRFRVQASTPSGTWHEARASQSIRVVPRFHETGLFWVLLGALGLAAVTAAWALATRLVRRRARELEAAVVERTVALATERDVVARQAARLGELAEARAGFLAAISHELRTPLTLVLGPLRDLRDARLGELPQPAHDEVEMSLRSAERLRRLVDRLLEVARSEAELGRLACRAGDLVAFVREQAEDLQHLAERNGSTLRLGLEESPIEIWFDPLQLETVLVNLVANAVKHTPAGTTIEVAVRQDDAQPNVICLVVSDDGPGIPARELPRLFDRFYRGNGESRTATDGFGLGLALVREVVERHGGTVEVVSGRSGSTFTVRLRRGSAHLRPEDLATNAWLGEAVQRPVTGALAAEPAPREPTGRRENGSSPGTRPAAENDADRTTVLVVDDNPDLRHLVRRQLEDRYRVLEAGDGRKALAAISELLPDLVLSDVMMPELDGLELCRAIRSDPATDFVPVVLLTALAETENRIGGFEGGADAYLAKPFDVAELRAVVDGLIASRRRLRDRYASQARGSGPVPVELPSESRGGDELGFDDRTYLERVEQAIESHLHDEDLSVDDLARLVAQSRVSLYRHVKRLRGCSPSDWIRAARLERAARMLARKEGSISEVAYAVGFKSTAHFSNCFLERYGVRPSQVHAKQPTPQPVESATMY